MCFIPEATAQPTVAHILQHVSTLSIDNSVYLEKTTDEHLSADVKSKDILEDEPEINIDEKK